MAIVFGRKKGKMAEWGMSMLSTGFVAAAIFAFFALPELNQNPSSEILFERTSALTAAPIFVDEEIVPAKAAILIGAGNKRPVLAQNIDAVIPVASLTKLMTAMVVFDNYALDDKIVISAEAVATPEPIGGLKVGGEISVKELLAVMLVTSSNDAAMALAENLPLSAVLTREEKISAFVEKMNAKAKILGLDSTVFFEPTGLSSLNVSSADDISKILMAVYRYPFVSQWTASRELVLQPNSALVDSHLKNTNNLLDVYGNIVLGKTGYTEQAGGALALLLEDKVGDDIFAAVVLGAEDRDSAMLTLLEWASNKGGFW